MLCSAYIEVDIAPVLVDILIHEGLFVLRIHIAEVIGRGTSEAGHGVKLKGEDGLVIDLVFAHYLVELGIPRPHLGAA